MGLARSGFHDLCHSASFDSAVKLTSKRLLYLTGHVRLTSASVVVADMNAATSRVS